jgi:dienelactone hydrolase
MFPSRLLLPAFAPLFLLTAAMAEPFPDPAQLPAQPPFPDPLLLRSGERVQTREQWLKQRAPELRQLFQHYEYGVFPPAPARVEARVDREDPAAFGGKATLRELTLSWGMPDVQIHLLLVVPNHREKPAPVFLGLNFNGNHALVADPLVRAPDPASYPDNSHGGPEAQRAKQVDVWNIEQSVDRGYAVASFFTGDVVPDQLAMARERLKRFRPAERADAPAADDCATLAAWAWGLMRAVDYLVTDPAIDGKKIAVVGHSRNGKTAILAAAMDERIALAIPLQAGCGGTAPARVAPELAVETVKRINTSFPHWFDDNFKQFNDAPERLPFDQDELIALCAPRPVLVCAATEDLWANPAGQFALLRWADPVYRLVAGDGMESSEMPAVSHLQKSRLSFFIRPGKHSMTKVDWDAFLDFADKWLR